MASAYGALADVVGGPSGLMQYLLLERNTYEQMALANAKAINGLEPKITVWNTGDQNGSAAGADAGGVEVIRNLMQSLPPLLSTIHDQTGIQPPGWLAKVPQVQDQVQMEKFGGKGVNGVNGDNGHI